MDGVNVCMLAWTVYVQHGQWKCMYECMYDSMDNVNVCMTAWTVYVKHGQCKCMYDSMDSVCKAWTV